jgi:hypothetical protein
MADMMTKAQKKAAVDLAWANYRAASQAIPGRLPYSGFKSGGVYRDGFLETDERLWKRYVAEERAILATPEPKATQAA